MHISIVSVVSSATQGANALHRGRRGLSVFVCLLLLGLGGGEALRAQEPFQPRTFTDPVTNTTYRLERYLLANFPVGMAFLPDGTLLYNEKTTGSVRLVTPEGRLQPQPVLTLPTSALQERGMLGLAVDPNFEQTRYIYVVHTREGTARDFPANQLVRFRLEEGRGVDPQVLASYPITNGSLLHNGGNVHFGTDGRLYLSLGDYGEAVHSQDLNSPLGKILRFQVTEDGLIPAVGNPYGDDNPAYAIGFRNPFDFTFDALTGRLYVSEVGPSCDDEINLVLPGFNYGWRPDYECVGTGLIRGLTLYAPPLLSFTPVEAPTGIIVYRGAAFPAWQGNLLFCNWNFGDLRRVVLSADGTKAEAVHKLDLGRVGCRIDLVEGPDGAIYFGTVEAGSGAIMRLVPVTE